MGYLDIDEMKRSMTQRAYLGWQKYWDQEPWGPWRDNVHTGIIAREVRRGRVKPHTRITLEQFMVRNPSERKKEGEENFFGMMKTVATPATPAEAEAKRRATRRSGVKKGTRNDRSRKTRR